MAITVPLPAAWFVDRAQPSWASIVYTALEGGDARGRAVYAGNINDPHVRYHVAHITDNSESGNDGNMMGQ